MGRDLSLLCSAHTLVFSLSRFPVRFLTRAAEDGPHPKPSGASEAVIGDFSGRSIVPYS